MAPNTNIDIATAKSELERINEVLAFPHLLIGGLAVQQYHPARDSKDIDLICEFETARSILEKLYPSLSWKVKNKLDDEYRPSYQITHRYEQKGTIIFGPKISERAPYNHLDWESLREEAKPFRSANGELANILVPTASALAYTKFISFLGRQPAHADKIRKDLTDFVDLTNQDQFSASQFYSFLRGTKAFGELCASFQERCKNHSYRQVLEQSCLYDISLLIAEPVPPTPKVSPLKKAIVYVAAPHKNVTRNKTIKEALVNAGFEVRVPYEEVAKRHPHQETDTPGAIRAICVDAINESQFVVVDLDTYGLDTAWELGYAEGSGKRVIGYNQDVFLSTDERQINRRKYTENFMHGWDCQPVFQDLGQLAAHCRDKTVYVAGSFSNEEAEEAVDKALTGVAKRLILPKKYIDNQRLLPKDYPLAERGETNNLLEGSDTVAVILPRYGMDSSWQIGYATAKKKELIGILMEDDRKTQANQSFWDHWMHGWKNKIRVTGTDELCSVLFGFWNYH